MDVASYGNRSCDLPTPQGVGGDHLTQTPAESTSLTATSPSSAHTMGTSQPGLEGSQGPRSGQIWLVQDCRGGAAQAPAA